MDCCSKKNVLLEVQTVRYQCRYHCLDTSAPVGRCQMSWVRSVLGPKCLDTLESCSCIILASLARFPGESNFQLACCFQTRSIEETSERVGIWIKVLPHQKKWCLLQYLSTAAVVVRRNLSFSEPPQNLSFFFNHFLSNCFRLSSVHRA